MKSCAGSSKSEPLSQLPFDTALMGVVRLLATDEILPRRNFDHLLSGDWADHRGCYMKPDLILI